MLVEWGGSVTRGVCYDAGWGYSSLPASRRVASKDCSNLGSCSVMSIPL
jgi:hypothetical protein